MKLLVIGKTGQLAQALSAVSRLQEIEVVCMGRPELDLADQDSVMGAVDLVKPDLIVNAGAYTAVDRAEEEVRLCYAVNALGAGNVAFASRCAEVPIVHISTDYVYAGLGDNFQSEEAQIGPNNTYGHSKLYGELLVREFAPISAIIRTSWVIGADGNNFVRTMLRLAAARDSLNVVDDQIGAPTLTYDLALAVIAVGRGLLSKNAGVAGVYNYCAAGAVSWADMARHIFMVSAAAGAEAAHVTGIPTSEYPTPAARPKNSRMDCSKIQSAFDVVQRDWRIVVEECVSNLLIKGV